MRVIFAGTPEFAVPALRSLVQAGFEVVAVYTQPDRPAGRGRELRPGAVKVAAGHMSLTVVQPSTLRAEETASDMKTLEPDVLVVVAYGLILPKRILEVPAHGCVNVHASLLPRWRGAAPVARAIEAGDTISGVSIMQMDEGLDTGPILAAKEVPIDREDNAQTLHDKLAVLGASLLVETLPGFVKGRIVPREQDGSSATYAPKLTKEEARVDWTRTAPQLFNQVRALNPWPVAHTFYGDQRIRILEARVSGEDHSHETSVGTICSADKDGVVVACGQGSLSLMRLQRDGGKPLAVSEFLNGFPLDPSTRFR